MPRAFSWLIFIHKLLLLKCRLLIIGHDSEKYTKPHTHTHNFIYGTFWKICIIKMSCSIWFRKLYRKTGLKWKRIGFVCQ